SIGGNHHRIDFLIGPGKALDTNKYFIIATDAIGNGLSTSPSNSKTQQGTAFPHFTIRDMVESQYRLVKEKFGITRLLAVSGASMVGNQKRERPMPSLIPDFATLERRLAGSPVVKHRAREVVLTEGSKTGGLLFLRRGTVEVVKDGVRIAS